MQLQGVSVTYRTQLETNQPLDAIALRDSTMSVLTGHLAMLKSELEEVEEK